MEKIENIGEKRRKWVFLATLILLVLLRFLHFGNFLDNPHAWRQADTAHYIEDFYENGIDVFHPAVCWMGGHKTLVLEFPLPEAIVAVFYELFGPDLRIARIIFLLFFCGSGYYFYRIAHFFYEKKVAQYSTIVYFAAPLSLYFSRSVQIDFTAMFFVSGMMFHVLEGMKKASERDYLCGALYAIPAFLIKAPYAFVAIFPLFWMMERKNLWKAIFKRIWLFLIPLILFIFWTRFAYIQNDLAPDWSFLPDYRKFTDNSHWYFGPLEQRWRLDYWQGIGKVLLNELLGFSGLLLAGVGLGGLIRQKKAGLVLVWLTGACVYVWIFFNLNRIHNYYQLPFLPVFSLLVGLGIHFLAGRFQKFPEWITVSLFLLLFSAESIAFTERNYFKRNTEFEQIGEIIHQNTAKSDLVAVSYGGLGVHFPTILYYSGRDGWSIRIHDLNAKIALNLREAGCNYLAIVRQSMPKDEFGDFIRFFDLKPMELKDGKFVYLVNLNKKKDGTPYNPADYMK